MNQVTNLTKRFFVQRRCRTKFVHRPLGSKNRGLCAHFPKNTALNPVQAKFYVSNAGFREQQMTKNINLRGIKRDGFPPQNCHFAPSFIFSKKKISGVGFREKNSTGECAGHRQNTFYT